MSKRYWYNKLLFVFAVIIGSVIDLKSAIDFSDLMILGMAFPKYPWSIYINGAGQREV